MESVTTRKTASHVLKTAREEISSAAPPMVVWGEIATPTKLKWWKRVACRRKQPTSARVQEPFVRRIAIAVEAFAMLDSVNKHGRAVKIKIAKPRGRGCWRVRRIDLRGKQGERRCSKKKKKRENLKENLLLLF
jgi:hypothetical protein